MRRLIRISAAAFLFLGLFWVALFSASIYTYASLTSEALVAELRFEPVGEQEYLARLRTGDFCEERAFRLLGDQWRIDAEFLKWKYWAIALGLDSQYRLDRLEGRYRTSAEQNVRPTIAHELSPETVVEIASISARLGPLNFLADASYGSSTYLDMDPGRVHRVYRTQTGLIARSEAELPPRGRETDRLRVEIKRSCGAEPGYWERLAVWLNERIAAFTHTRVGG